MTSSARRRLDLSAVDLSLDRAAGPAMAVAVLASALLIYHLTRGSSFLADDWTWIQTRRGNTVHAFLAPYNGHLSLVPIAIYRLMFALFGIGDFAPFRVLLVIVTSVTGFAIFEYARRRVGPFGALVAATLVLFAGPGWNDLLQPFQIAWLIAVTCGVLALSLLDRRRRRTDAAACLLVLISLASTSVGVAFAVAIAVDIALARRRWRDAWIVGLPMALYVAWAVHYHASSIQWSAVTNAPLNLAQVMASALAGLVGLSSVTPSDLTGVAPTFGLPLLAVTVAAVVIRMRAGWDWTRFLALAAALVTFSLLTSLARSSQSPFESRYLFVVCVLGTLIVVELARGLTATLLAQVSIGVLALVAITSNIGVLQSGGAYFRTFGAQTDATLAAVELDRDRVASSAWLTQLPFFPLVQVTAGQYFTIEHALGTPAYTLAQLVHANPGAQAAADAQLLSERDIVFTATRTAPTGGAAPSLESVVGGTVSREGACVTFLPAAALAPGAASALFLELGPGGVSVTAGQTPVVITVRRFAPAYTALGTVQAGGTAAVSVSADRAEQPWHVQIQSSQPVHACTLGSA